MQHCCAHLMTNTHGVSVHKSLNIHPHTPSWRGSLGGLEANECVWRDEGVRERVFGTENDTRLKTTTTKSILTRIICVRKQPPNSHTVILYKIPTGFMFNWDILKVLGAILNQFRDEKLWRFPCQSDYHCKITNNQ